jgi:intein/homing endonuclease
VYDITVPEGENFLANGVIIHNCPRCSDTRWMREGIVVSDSMALFAEKVQLLHNGVCPHCGATRSELIKTGELNFYQELAGLAGQRCVTGSTVINTKRGPLHIDDLDRGLGTEYTSLSNATIMNGDFTISECQAIYKCRPEKAYRMVLENGMSIEGTKEHPMLTSNGHIPLAAIHGEYVPVKFGVQAFGQEPLNDSLVIALAYFCSDLALIPQRLETIEGLKHFNQEKLIETLTALCGFALDGNTDNYSVPKAIRQSDKQAVILFLRTYLGTISHCSEPLSIYFTIKSERMRLVICNYLQMLGIRFNIAHTTVYIDGGSNQIFSTLFLHKEVKNTYSNYSAYERDAEDGNCYWLKVVYVEETKVKTTYDFVVPDTHEFIANGLISHNSGKSAIVAMCCAYLLHKQLKLQKPNEVYGLLPANVLHGTFVALTYKQAAETLWEPFLAYITDSPWFCIAEDSLVTMADNSKKPIQTVEIGDKVKTFEGENTVTNVFDNGYQECFAVTLQNGSTVEATAEHKIQCLSADGKTLVWKKVQDLTPDDYVVTSN